MHLADAFIQSDDSGYAFFQYVFIGCFMMNCDVLYYNK